MNDLRTIWGGLDWGVLSNILLSIIPALLCVMVHEVCHGLAALRMGDETAKSQGRLSFNPLRHIDPMGLIMLAVFRFGWAKPVSVDMRNFKNPKRGMAVTALAGPASNLVLAALLIAVYGFFARPLMGLGRGGYSVAEMILRTAVLSLGFCVFNLLPVPPLDGSKVLFSFFSDRLYYQLMRYERYGMVLVFVLAITGILGGPVGFARDFLYEMMLKYIAVPLSFLSAGVF